MKKTFNILGIPGSLRRQSYNLSALRAAQQLAPEGVSLKIFDLNDIPGFNEDHEKNLPPKIVELKKQIRDSDAIIFATPEYNYSIPGVLKNAIDWVSRPYGESAWTGKPAAIMGASVGSIATARAQYHLRQICVNLNLLLLNQPEVMIGQAAQKFDAEGNLTDESTKKHISKLIVSLVEWTERLSR